MAVESLMSEDDADQDCCRGKFVDGDETLFLSLLHFADHCLYKIVRWARNLLKVSNQAVLWRVFQTWCYSRR